jgi:hypothetical protein|tara:strand:- start:660 stop:1739 length:1080 start_codon:yes stop_codon:yes gene_type:complete
MANNPLRRAQLNTGYQMDLSNFDPSAPSTEFSDILENYDTDKLMAEYGDYFDEYDPSQEAFAQRGLALQEGDITAQAQQQQAGFDRASAALDFGEQQQRRERLRSGIAFNLQQQGLERQQSQLERQGAQAVDQGRMSLMNLYEQQQENMGGGFASTGRDSRAQRAIDAQTGAFDTQLLNLRDTEQSLQDRGQMLDLERQAQLSSFEGRDFQRAQQRGELADQRTFAEGATQRSLDRAALGFEQDIFGMRQRFAGDTRRTLINLMDDGAELDRFRLDYVDPNEPTGASGKTLSEFISDPNVSGARFQNEYLNERFGQTGGGGVGTFDALSTDAQDYFGDRQGYGETQAGQQFFNDYSMRG